MKIVREGWSGLFELLYEAERNKERVATARPEGTRPYTPL